jgi:transcriptional regulator with XRE-family HTH domain
LRRLFYSFESMNKEKVLEDYQVKQMKELSSALKRLRIERGYSNYDILAYDMGMSRSQYGAYENGQNLTLATLMKILNHFNMTIFDFFDYIKTS